MQANNLISSVTIAGTTATKDVSRETDTFRAVYIFRVKVVNSGQTDVTINLPAADTFSISLSIDEWSGLAPTPLDTTGSAAPTGTTLCSVNASDFTTQADELVYAAVIFSSNPGATTFPSGYTTSFNDVPDTYYWSAAAYQTISSITLANAIWTATNSINSRLALATYKIATAPTIDAQPEGVVAPYGTTATFSVSASSNTGAMTYQWEESVDSGSNWDKAPGTYTNSTYSKSGLTFAQNGYLYRVKVTNGVGTTTSSSALLTVPSPGISTQPASQTIVVGSVTVSVVAQSNDAPSVTYQWYFAPTPGDGFAPISGATSSSYTSGTLTTADSGCAFMVQVTDSFSSIFSAPAKITVNTFSPSASDAIFDGLVFDSLVFDTTISGSVVTGSLAATEGTSDTFAGTGSAVITSSGALAATEGTSDTFAGTGSATITSTGSLAATDASDTLAATGQVLVKGALAATDAADTAALTGKVFVRGSLAATDGADTFAASGGIPRIGSLAATEVGSDVPSIEGVVRVRGSLAVTEGAKDTLAASGKVLVKGFLTASDGADTAAFTGDVLVRGSLAATEAKDTIAIGGGAVRVGSMAATESADTLAATGKVIVKGALSVTEAAVKDTFAGVAKLIVSGSLVASEQAIKDAFAGTGVIPRAGNLSASDAADGFAATGAVTNGFTISGYHALLVMKIYKLHGLAEPLVVTQNSRSAGDMVQSVSENGGTVTVETTAEPESFAGSLALMIEALGALHGITETLEVSATQRTAGSIVQTISQAGDVTTITRTA
jgi:hypothetical protein